MCFCICKFILRSASSCNILEFHSSTKLILVSISISVSKKQRSKEQLLAQSPSLSLSLVHFVQPFMEEGQQEGGLLIPQRKDKHEFRAPAPRTSLLGELRLIAEQRCHTVFCHNRCPNQSRIFLNLILRCRVFLHMNLLHHAGLDRLAKQKRLESGQPTALLGGFRDSGVLFNFVQTEIFSWGGCPQIPL